MQEIINILKKSSPAFIICVVILYFMKFYAEQRLGGLSGRIEEIAKTSLEIKKELRGEERSGLVDFRVAVEKWQDFLLTAPIDFTMMPPSEAKISSLYEKDKELFLDVKIAIIKASIYLRDEALEKQLMDTVLRIRRSYYPLINESLLPLIDIQSKLAPFEFKLKKFQESGFKDMTFAPTVKDAVEQAKLQAMMTQETSKFSEKYLQQYQKIAEQMDDLKEAINRYIYRPVEQAAVDKD